MNLRNQIVWAIFFIIAGFIIGGVFAAENRDLFEVVLSFFKEYAEAFIALIAIVFTILQATSIAKEKMLASMPEIIKQIGFQDSNGQLNDNQALFLPSVEQPHSYSKTVTMINKGLGPARILQIEIYYTDQLLTKNSSTDLHANVMQTLKKMNLDIQAWHFDIWQEKELVSSNEGKAFLSLTINYRNQSERDKLNVFFDNIHIKISYESLYKEHKYFPLS